MRKSSGPWEEVVSQRELLLHALKIHSKIIFPRELCHLGEVVDLLVGLHGLQMPVLEVAVVSHDVSVVDVFTIRKPPLVIFSHLFDHWIPRIYTNLPKVMRNTYQQCRK